MIRSTFAGMTTAFSALQANQKRLNITGQNLANMNTPGYTRQALQTSSLNYTNPISHYMNNSSLAVGFGVHMDKITQIRDPYLDIQYRDQIKKSGYAEAMQSSLDELAKIFDESDADGIWQAVIDVRSTLLNIQDPSKINDPIFETELRSRMQALTNLLNDASNQIDRMERDEFAKLDGTGSSEQGSVDRVNDILREIGQLNRQIKNNQIFGQESLELMDDRNVLLDELASYIPIEVSYYKDVNFDGVTDAKDDLYYRDDQGNIIGKREWPDDLRVEMLYQDENGDPQRLTLVEGTVGKGNDNFGKVDITGGSLDDPTKIALTFQGFQTASGGAAQSVVFAATAHAPTKPGDSSDAYTEMGNRFAEGSGSIQASLDMLWRVGVTTQTGDGAAIKNVKGFEYYRNQLNTFSYSFAGIMNAINNKGTNAGSGADLFVAKDGSNPITAANIGINPDWSNGNVHISTCPSGGDQTDTIMNMLRAMDSTFNTGKVTTITPSQGSPSTVTINGDDYNLENNTFADYINHIAAVLSNDSSSNTAVFKTSMTVLNGIQDSRDAISGVSLDEEASNMMMYMSAYNAASRLMTTLDQALETLITGTGTVGR